MKTATTSRIGNDALQEKTGKTWAEWFSLLDRDDATKQTHQDIVGLLHSKHGVGQWYGQMIAVGYEQERGLRVPHQKPNGFEISVSKTVNIPAGTAFLAFHDPKFRKRWLADPDLEIRKSTVNKSLRITWGDGKTSLSIDLYPKGANKTQIAVQHQKIESAKAAEKWKTYWAAQLEKLRTTFEP